MRELAPGYRYEIDTPDERTWHEDLRLFDDANIYQTWTYEAVRSGEKNVGHFVLRKNGQAVAIAQARLLRIPLLNLGVAYVRWGPLWRLSGKDRDLEDFRQAVRGLRNEYVIKRGLVLRLYPYLFDDEAGTFLPILADEGYELPAPRSSGQTALMDLSSQLEILRKGLDPKWRNHLNASERKSLAVIEGFGDDLFGPLMRMYDEMVERKRFARPNDINEFRDIQKKLPPGLKMRILLCLSDGRPVAGALCSTTGEFGMSIYRATNEIGRKINASYLLQWRIIEWVKEQGCAYYNVNGVNPEANPGTFSFKMGLCGKNGKVVYYLGMFDSHPSVLMRYLVKWAEKLKSARRIIKRRSSEGTTA